MVTKHGQKTIAAGELKATLLRVLEEVRTGKESVIVTKRGVPIARIGPVDPRPEETSLEGSVLASEDIVGPFHEEWEPTA